MLTRHDIGHRVTIRRTIPPDEAGHTHAELVGQLTELTETELVIATRRGVVAVPRAAVSAARRMPQQRRFSATGQLELIAAAGWPAPEVSRLGDWLLRAADGWTARANSALPVGEPGLPIPEAVDAVIAWYTERHLQPAMMVPGPIGGTVTAELRSRGWVSDPPVLFMTATVSAVLAQSGPMARNDAAAAPHTVRVDPVPPQAWFEALGAMSRGLSPAGRAVLTGVPNARYAGVYEASGPALAVGRGVIATDGRWLGLSALEVAPAARRRRVATSMIQGLAQWAAGAGATDVYLQVVEGNAPAVALYERLGFTTHHSYTTWRVAR